jgi:hypothetical protein
MFYDFQARAKNNLFYSFNFLLFAIFTPPYRKGFAIYSSEPKLPNQDVEILTAQLLKDLPSYANRVSQRLRRPNRTFDIYTYVLLAGRPEFAPLTLGPGEYLPSEPAALDETTQVFITTLERQYTDGKPVELQEYHWLFLTKTDSGWRLAMMFSRTGTYPSKQPPTRPRDSSNGVIAQAVRTWLRDCQAGSVRVGFSAN